ncbi:MAG: molybdopterin dinucleotide binding domain-containing protein [Nitrobacter sp.]
MHPADAQRRGLVDGDIVRLFNGRGACLAGVRISDNIREGVVFLWTGAWFNPDQPGVPGSIDKHGNPNVLTHDLRTSRLAQGPAAHSTLIEVERFEGIVPEVTAFLPPRGIS